MGSGASSSTKTDKIEEQNCSPHIDLNARNNNEVVKCEDPSPQIAPQQQRNERVEKTPIKKIKQSEVTRLKQELEKSQKSQQEKDATIKGLEEKLTTVDKQMGELECNNFDLHDRIHQLEETLKCSMPSRTLSLVAEETELCPETLQAKNKYIEQLEKETEQVKVEIKKLKIRCKKKLRALNAQLSESKQAHSVKMMEMKLETKQDKSGSGESGGSHHLIVELSSRVNEQETEIAELTQKIADKEKEMAALKEGKLAKLSKSGSPSSEIRRWTSTCVTDIINNAASLLDNVDSDLPSGTSEKTDSLSREKSRISSAASANTSAWSSEDEEVKSKASTDTYTLDPASIRRISAAKDRRKRTRNPPLKCTDEVKFTETEDLIKSLEHKPEMPAVY